MLLDGFWLYLPPIDRPQGMQWCYMLVARTSGCLATATLIAYFHSNTGFSVPSSSAIIPTPLNPPKGIYWCHWCVARTHGCLATSFELFITLATVVSPLRSSFSIKHLAIFETILQFYHYLAWRLRDSLKTIVLGVDRWLSTLQFWGLRDSLKMLSLSSMRVAR